ncbi:MAG: hypothetical protein WDW38_011097 [Sanguina aurantia]
MASKLQDLKDKQNRWMRERQAEMDRHDVMAELQPQGYGQQSGHSSAPPARSSPQTSLQARIGGGARQPSSSSSSTASNPATPHYPGPRYGSITHTNGDGRGGNSSGNNSPVQQPDSGGHPGPTGHATAVSSNQPRGSRFQDPTPQSQTGSRFHDPQHRPQTGPSSSHQDPGYDQQQGRQQNGGGGGGGGGGTTHGSAQFWAQVKPEDVIDRLTERITDRLRSELKVELQKESDTWQGEAEAGDRYLAKELESQNTCPICYDLMVPPDHAPVMLFPCGHTFCGGCIKSHTEKHHKSHCPLCRKRIESKAPNFSLQQLILNWVGRQARVKASGSLRESAVYRESSSGNPDGGGGSSFGQGGQGSGGPSVASEEDRLRRQADRMAMRLKVLSNEMLDTLAEEAEVEGQRQAAAAVLSLLQGQEQDVLRRMAGLQQELEHLHTQMEAVLDR